MALGRDYADMVSADQLHMTDASYRCMAGALAASLQDAVDRQTASARNTSRFAAAARLPGVNRTSSLNALKASVALSQPR